MTEDQMLQAMLKDAQQINKRYREKWGGKPDKKYTEPEPDKPEKKFTEPEATAAPTQGEGWRNDSLSEEEIEDIRYFRDRGWCVSSTAIFVGVSNATVRKYDNRSTES